MRAISRRYRITPATVGRISIPGEPTGIPGTAKPRAYGLSASRRISAAGTCPSMTTADRPVVAGALGLRHTAEAATGSRRLCPPPKVRTVKPAAFEMGDPVVAANRTADPSTPRSGSCRFGQRRQAAQRGADQPVAVYRDITHDLPRPSRRNGGQPVRSSAPGRSTLGAAAWPRRQATAIPADYPGGLRIVCRSGYHQLAAGRRRVEGWLLWLRYERPPCRPG